MTALRFLWRSLVHYWRTNLAVLLGVIAGTAVLAGALIVGDSVTGSLRQMTLDRLGGIDHVLAGPQFFRESIATELSALPDFQRDYTVAAPAIMLPCNLERSFTAQTGETRQTRAGGVNLYAIDGRSWDLTQHCDLAAPNNRELLLSRRVADQLGAKVGDELQLWMEIPPTIPQESLLGKRDQPAISATLTLSGILDEASGVARLGLRPNQQVPLNAFVSLATIQEALGVAEVTKSPLRAAAPARVNTLFVSARTETGRSIEAAERLTDLLRRVLHLADLDLRIVPHESQGYFSLESSRMILEENIGKTASEVAAELKLPASPVLVYLANEIGVEQAKPKYAMYSVVAGVDLATAPPFGPYEFVGPAPSLPLGPDEIVINDWLAEDLAAKPGETIRVKYHVVGSRGELPEVEHDFVLRGILKLEGTRASDRGLTPEVKGITDVKTLKDWDQPFPMKFDRITQRDDDYWDEYRATPKAFVSLKTAQELWKSRYGDLTSIRIAIPAGKTETETAELFGATLLARLPLDKLGMAFAAVKSQGLMAAGGTTPFGGLFIGFSFFLIASATILIGLLFRLGIERRVSEVGLLLAVGLSPRRVRRLLLVEGLAIVGCGSVLGLFAAVGYADLMVYGLTTWWIGATGTRFLALYVTMTSLIVGLFISIVVAALAVGVSLRKLFSISERSLLAGVTQTSLTDAQQRRRAKRNVRIAEVSGVIATFLIVAVIVGLIPQSQAFGGIPWPSVAFFVGGTACLVASICAFSAWLDSDRAIAVQGRGIAGMGRLGLRNASRHRSRSVLTVGLIASATFVIVAVAAGQRNPAREEPEKDSGNGGFTLVAESDRPILFDLNTPDGRDKLDLSDSATTAGLAPVRRIVPFRVKPGDDASCLNLYRTRLPTILGVPQEMIERGGFRFVGASGNPWTILNEHPDDGAIPVFGDMNTLMYSMQKQPGDMIPISDAPNSPRLRISGMLADSVFQGVLLMAEDRFRELFPDQAGYRYFLIDVPLTDAQSVSELLETKLVPFGFDVDRVGDRLADFLAVQNTYLSTFRTLGGLGLLLGTFGLATVMLRNVLERRGELALLRAVGFANGKLTWLVLWETGFLLIAGLAAGACSALLAMTPLLLGTGADVPWLSAGLMLVSIFVVGMLAASFAVVEALRTPVLATLRSE